MKRIVLVVSVLLFVGCSGLNPSLIKDSAVNICVRHNAYVNADATLTEEQKALFEQEADLMLKVILEAKE